MMIDTNNVLVKMELKGGHPFQTSQFLYVQTPPVVFANREIERFEYVHIDSCRWLFIYSAILSTFILHQKEFLKGFGCECKLLVAIDSVARDLVKQL